ncbi:MAG: 16S rRNA (cytosine(1402)-N(4))-methyltransferase RsmH [Anaerolineaceae bacterium]|nr:16S rRNA (cytosine(1402)-N(4))-methyltransferase RsmH [Anaerolineaceae bacterium]
MSSDSRPGEDGAPALRQARSPHAPTWHTPVLVDAVLLWLLPAGRLIDGTVGAGGHSEALLAGGAGALLGLDLDREALALARERLSPWQGRVTLRHGSYEDMRLAANSLGWREVDGILLDLGVSSLQLDRAERGFALRHEGPLDMRFDPASGIADAESLVNDSSEEALTELFRRFGEERHSRRLARMIVRERPFSGSGELARAIARATPRPWPRRIHPATRVFQALRIAVNDELETLRRALPEALSLLRPGGRLVVISFHSLEDRIVKHWMQQEERDCVCPPQLPVCACDQRARLRRLRRRPLVADAAERGGNPRSRSAKLRVAEKL